VAFQEEPELISHSLSQLVGHSLSQSVSQLLYHGRFLVWYFTSTKNIF